MADPDEGAQEPDATTVGGAEGAARPSGDGSGVGGLTEPGTEATGAPVPDAVATDADVPELQSPGAGAAGAAVADADVPDLKIPDAETVVPGLEIPDAETFVPDLEIPDADVPELDQREPVIPDPVLPESFLTEPVIPPPPPDDPPVARPAWRSDRDYPAGSGTRVPEGAPSVTRATRRAASDSLGSPSAPAPDLRLTAPDPDPAVVPPPSGATSGGYRGLTIAIYGVLGALLVGAVVMISTLLR